MTRSRAVNLVLLVSSVAALEACSRRQCIDQNNVVVDERYCDGQFTAGSFGYHWYSHSGSGVPIGGHISTSSSGTAHGVFGGAGDAAGHGGSGE